MLNAYHKEQADAIVMVRQHLHNAREKTRSRLMAHVSEYLDFRKRIDRFLSDHFAETCTAACFKSRLSACCSREGIITFFADTVINTLVSHDAEIRSLLAALERPNKGYKCVYLGENGCTWRVRPIVCAMFICDSAADKVFFGPDFKSDSGNDGPNKAVWEALQEEKKTYTWPDRPVLFDFLEKEFITAGYESSLMYLHNSPGMRRLKQQAGIL